MRHHPRRRLEDIPDEEVNNAIRVLHDKLGRIPRLREVLDEYNQAYSYYFREKRSFNTCVSEVFNVSRRPKGRLTKETLIRELQDWYKAHGRQPYSPEFRPHNGLHHAQTYVRCFGTLNNARLAAGLKAIIIRYPNSHLELSAEEYKDYKLGLGPHVTKKILLNRQRMAYNRQLQARRPQKEKE